MGGQWKSPEVSRLFPQEKAPRLGEQGTSAVCSRGHSVTRSAQKQELEDRRSVPCYGKVYALYELQTRLIQELSARITEGLVFSPLRLPGRWLLLSRAPQGSQDFCPQLREKAKAPQVTRQGRGGIAPKSMEAWKPGGQDQRWSPLSITHEGGTPSREVRPGDFSDPFQPRDPVTKYGTQPV